MIGLIIPPVEIKKLIETTSAWVAQNGSNFQEYLIEKSKNDVKFAFLNETHPYRAYFDQMVEQYRAKIIEGPAKEEGVQKVEDVKKQQAIVEGVQEQQKQFIDRVFKQIKVPDPDQYLMDIPEKLTFLDIDIIQHTAQYVAKNGKKFLEALGQRQKSNPQFQFLKSTSPNYKFFISLVDSYTKVLSLKLADIDKLSQYLDRQYILRICSQKFQYEQQQQKLLKGKKIEMQVEEDNIDWNDFQLVQTIEFEEQYTDSSANAIDHIPEIMKRKLVQTDIISSKPTGMLQSCANCGKYIPSSEINSHIKICMLDPKEKARRLEAKNRIQSSGNQVNISQNISNLAAKKQDVFGPSDLTFQPPILPNKINAIWDGQNPNMTRTTASIAMMQNQKRKLQQSLRNNKK